MVLPLAKIFAVLVRQLSKPFADRIKTFVAEHPRWNKRLSRFGQMCYRTEVALYFENPMKVRLLSFEESVAKGSEYFGGFIVFSVATAVVLFEYDKSVQKEIRKDEQYWTHINSLERRQKAVINDLQQTVLNMKINTDMTFGAKLPPNIVPALPKP